MATTTATITISSGDLTGDALSLSTTSTLYKANQTVGLENTSGVGRTKVVSTTIATLYDGDAYDDGSHKVYLANKSTDATEYFLITMNAQEIGKLYAGDWLFLPWEAAADTSDIKYTASVATGMVLEHMIISE